MEGLSYTPPSTPFAGDSGQESNMKETVFATSHRYIQYVRQPLFPCVCQSVLSRGGGAGGCLVVAEMLQWSPCQRGDGQGLLVLEIPSNSKTPWPWEGLLDSKAGLEGAAAVPVCPRGWEERLSPSGHAVVPSMGHIWSGRCGGLARGPPSVVWFHPLSPPFSLLWFAGLPVGCCAVGRRGHA